MISMNSLKTTKESQKNPEDILLWVLAQSIGIIPKNSLNKKIIQKKKLLKKVKTKIKNRILSKVKLLKMRAIL